MIIGMVNIFPIPAFNDNYIWAITSGDYAVIVDPGDANPVIQWLNQHQIKPIAILITHHHSDHIDGVDPLQAQYNLDVYAPQKGQYAFKHIPVSEGDELTFKQLNIKLVTLETPGHTLDHVAYYGANSLFCGDTLFACGCGRLFEGSYSELYHSLQKLSKLPIKTNVYCTHEYTISNINFAKTIEPSNHALLNFSQKAIELRKNHLPTLPTTIGQEIETNPFLRCHLENVQRQLQANTHDEIIKNPEATFRIMRMAKNNF